jgi:hypothetical protein
MLGDLTSNYNGIPRSYYLWDLLATCPRDSPAGYRAGRRSVCSAGADGRNRSVLLRAFDATGSGFYSGENTEKRSTPSEVG